MFHPVGSEPPSVYWRRRLVFAATLVVLLVLVVVTARVLVSGDGEAAPPAGQGTGSTHLPPTTTSSHPSTSHRPSPSSSSSSATRSASSGSSSTSAAPRPCDRADLEVQAVSDKTEYAVGDKPKLMLQVTDTAKTPCVQDLADKQVELRVYNGESRVWGSHDCLVQSGTNAVTLVPAAPVRVTIVWSGLSSKANDAHTQESCGPRQLVGAGTYTLYPYLADKAGHAAQFSIS